MEINIFYIQRQLMHTATFTMRRSKHKKYIKHTNITSNSDLCAYDRLTTQMTVLMNLDLHNWNG